jgi:hypothetical protein
MKQQTYWQKRNHTAKQTYRTQLQNNKETHKTKNSRQISPRGYYTIQKNTVAKHQIHMGEQKQTKKTSSGTFPAQHRSRLSRSTPLSH